MGELSGRGAGTRTFMRKAIGCPDVSNDVSSCAESRNSKKVRDSFTLSAYRVSDPTFGPSDARFSPRCQ